MQCSACLDNKTPNQFYKNGKSLTSKCKSCYKLAVSIRFNANRDANLQKKRAHYKANADRLTKDKRIKYATNSSKILQRNAAWVKANRAHIQAYMRNYCKTHPWAGRAAAAKRRADLALRTPSWAEHGVIREFYRNCPAGYHVDHIIPLRGKLVSGLHVLSNLQYLSASENVKKHNKIDIEKIRA